ncbi:MAG: hypothetical protein FJ039_07790 [Chloroflexi bacterium]|nr:hypothetical protein [Chloroflexota bacterium]
MEHSSTILFAQGGKGKSTLALLMAVSVDAGVQTFWPVLQRRALFVNLERSRESVRNRIALVNRALGLPVERELLTLNARGRPFEALVEPLREAIAKRAVGLVVVDSISRTGYGKLTDDDTANRVMDAGNALGVAILWIGHTPRADESQLFGSTMFRNGADVEVRVPQPAAREPDGPGPGDDQGERCAPAPHAGAGPGVRRGGAEAGAQLQSGGVPGAGRQPHAHHGGGDRGLSPGEQGKHAGADREGPGAEPQECARAPHAGKEPIRAHRRHGER